MKKFILEINELCKSYDGVKIIDNVSLEAESGTICLITGENGAGKTTLFNMVNGLESPDDGNIFFNDVDITKFSPLNRARLGIGRLYQRPRLFRNLSVFDNLAASERNLDNISLLSRILKPLKNISIELSLQERIISILKFFNLEHKIDALAGELSYGEQKVISFCSIYINSPDLILLDEPFSGLNSYMIKPMKEIIKEMKDNGITFLIIEHNLIEANNLCDKHIIMHEGKISTPGIKIQQV